MKESKTYFDYKDINVVTTPHSDKVITMNEATFTRLIVNLYEAQDKQEEDNRNATAHNTGEMIEALRQEDKNEK